MTIFKITELFVIYSKTKYDVSRPYTDKLFTSREEAEDAAIPLKQEYPENDNIIGTLEEWIDDYSSSRYNEGYQSYNEE